MCLAVIHASDEGPLKEDLAACRGAVCAAGIHEDVEGPLPACGDEGGAVSFRGSVQAHGEMVGTLLTREPQDAGHDADGADGDMTGADIESARVCDDLQRGHYGVVVIQRFAHAHEDEISQSGFSLAAECPLAMEYLGDNLIRAEMAHKAHLSCGAKDAPHGTADLGAETGGVSTCIAHEDRLDRSVIAHLEQILPRESVGTSGLGDGGRRLQAGWGRGRFLCDPAAERWRKVGPFGEIHFPVESTPECPRVELRHAGLRQFLL